ncbi:hypothetical protein, variant 1 [Aphanomyces invadans]|uniref:Uncharacterized protein n=1 Tax=Aphanomyces invadans TaxID=157072 RepID=A0A024UUE1_9STRA|nr:hypothetical protein, variant 1 [Aphanomyces invadans]ETW09939.1 hypothetical protein, variant 1 [Aphanomyces invadans]|eukprot:XP_008861351.1 hypothetical protein, variant 1 [Aphanomyces invadans]
MFKARAKKDKPTRKRPVEVDEDDGETEHLTLEELRELKEDQKFRERKRLQGDKTGRKIDSTTPSSSASSDSSLSTLSGQFTAQSADKPFDAFEAIKNKYIEDKLREKYTSTIVTTVPPPSKERIEELELYSIPEHIRLKTTDEAVVKQLGTAVLARNASVPEIDLPSADPAKVLQATKEALVLRQKNQLSTTGSSSLPTNYSTNYTQHKDDHSKNTHASKKGEEAIDQQGALERISLNRVSSAS